MILEAPRAVLDLLLPRRCVVCGERLQLRENYLCIPCLADIPYTFFWSQPRNPMADSLNAHIQAHVQPGSAECYAYAAALFYYSPDSGYKHITRHLKYEHGVGLGRYFASAFGEKLAQAPRFADVDAVIPVPLHWARRLKRGYNQAEIIAKELARWLNAPLRTDVLRRAHRTSSQTRLSQEARQTNIGGAFVARRNISARHVLLVDDVFTTGATVGECYRALREVLPTDVRISVATLAFVYH